MNSIVSLFDRILYKLEYSKLNVLKTLIFNFRTMPFSVAIKLPVFLYGKIDLYFLKGKIEFQNCEIEKGMIKMGMNKDYLGTHKGASVFILSEESKIIFNGQSEFYSNFLLRTGKGGVLNIGKDTLFGNSVKLVCIKTITIGEGTRIAFEGQVIDSNFHYIYNLDKEEVKPRETDINIGTYNWIGNRTTISKGARTNSFTIVASSSVLSRDYTKTEDKFVVLAGQPAKMVAKDMRRVYNIKLENTLFEYFEQGNKTISEDLKIQIEESLKSVNIYS